MAHTFTEKVGIINDVLAYMGNAENAAALLKRDFDVTPHIARLNDKLKNINQIAPEQKALEVAHIRKTADLNHATDDTYTDASGTLDAIMGLLGKNTPEAKKAQTIRSKIRRTNTPSTTPPTAPSN